MIWLKEQYVRMYLEDGSLSNPIIMDSIKVIFAPIAICPSREQFSSGWFVWTFLIQVFGGRDWSNTGTSSSISPPENGTIKRGTSIRFYKKRSNSNLQKVSVINTFVHMIWLKGYRMNKWMIMCVYVKSELFFDRVNWSPNPPILLIYRLLAARVGLLYDLGRILYRHLVALAPFPAI